MKPLIRYFNREDEATERIERAARLDAAMAELSQLNEDIRTKMEQYDLTINTGGVLEKMVNQKTVLDADSLEKIQMYGKIVATVCYLFHGNEVALLHRVNKEPMKDSYIGFGGKCEVDETPFECVTREVFEELGISISPSYHGFGTYVREGEPTWEVHYFRANAPRDISVCTEGNVFWIDKDLAVSKIDVHDISMYKALLKHDMIFSKFYKEKDGIFVEIPHTFCQN